MMLAWNPGASPGDCVFDEWRVEWRVPPHEWVAEIACSGLKLRDTPSNCNITELEPEEGVEFRLAEKCKNPSADGAFLYGPLVRWARPGEWDLYVGPNPEVSVLVDVLAVPHGCAPASKTDDFSICYDGGAVPGRSATITRTDAASGWGSGFWLRCFTQQADGLIEDIPASEPALLELRGTTMHSVFAHFRIGEGIGSCKCATPHMELRAEGKTEWTHVTGTDASCADMSKRDCTSQRLQPDTQYHGRLRVACDDPALDSNFTLSVSPGTTFPGCTWSSHSDREDQFLCKDGTFCSAAGDSSCCNTRGGRARCPPSAPIMCVSPNACAGGKDFCCAVDCTAFGGELPCARAQVPAKAPVLINVASLAPASLVAIWSASQYSAGKSVCVFSNWTVELAQVGPSGISDWWVVAACASLDRSATRCDIVGLQGMASYSLRVRERCHDAALDSLPTIATAATMTLPVPAAMPVWFSCTNSTRDSLEVVWHPGAAWNCTFSSWELELSSPSREVGRWTQVCATYSREQSSCLVGNLSSNSNYVFRVHERCLDPRADSGFRECTCQTDAVVAQPPSDLAVFAAGKDFFWVRWDAGETDADSCVFVTWELQAIENATNSTFSRIGSDTDEEIPMVFACFVADRNITSCMVSVASEYGGGPRYYRVWVRETCMEPSLSSEWAYLVGSAITISSSTVVDAVAISNFTPGFVAT